MLTFDQDLTEPYRELTCTECGNILIKGHFYVHVISNMSIKCPNCVHENQTNQEIENGKRTNNRYSEEYYD